MKQTTKTFMNLLLISGFFYSQREIIEGKEIILLIDWLRKPRKGIIVRVYMYTVLMFYAFIQCFQRLTAIHSSAVMTAYHLYSIGYFSIWQTWVSLLPTNSQWCGVSQVILTCSNNSVPTSNIGMVITFFQKGIEKTTGHNFYLKRLLNATQCNKHSNQPFSSSLLSL